MMKPILEKITVHDNQSFAIKEEILPFIKLGWHYHPEYELVLFTEGTGKRFIGDHIDILAPSNLLLLGPHLPHYMRNDEEYYKGNPTLRMRAIVVHFSTEFCGRQFFDMPELIHVKKILQKSAAGLQVTGQTQLQLVPLMEKLLVVAGFEKLSVLITILDTIAMSKEVKLLSSKIYTSFSPHEDTTRIDKVFEMILQNYTQHISLARVAEKVNMSISAFCKFHKKRTGKTFSQTLNEIRIGHACKLFIDTEMTVAEVAFESGFNNLSYFHRNFKKITGFAPFAYKKTFFR
jgi:AraC-like DNA-binding protein